MSVYKPNIDSKYPFKRLSWNMNFFLSRPPAPPHRDEKRLKTSANQFLVYGFHNINHTYLMGFCGQIWFSCLWVHFFIISWIKCFFLLFTIFLFVLLIQNIHISWQNFPWTRFASSHLFSCLPHPPTWKVTMGEKRIML